MDTYFTEAIALYNKGKHKEALKRRRFFIKTLMNRTRNKIKRVL